MSRVLRYAFSLFCLLAFSVTAFAQLPPSVHKPIQAGGVMAIDLPDSTAQAVTLDILKGRFSDYSVGRLVLTGTGINFRNGTLQGLRADITEGDFDTLKVDRLSLATPPFAFNTMELINNKTFVLSQPVNAQVNLQISEENLNRFLANPKTLGKIEQAIAKKTGGIKLVTFGNPSLNLLSGNRVKLNVTANLLQGLSVPMEMLGKLVLKDGQLVISDLTLASNGQAIPLPVDVTSVFQDRLNEMINFKRLGKNALVIQAESMRLSGKGLNIEGHAALTKLRFGA